MLEKQIEDKGNRYGNEKGIKHYKFVSPSRRSVPDQLYLAKIPVILRPIIAKYVRFIEYKATGKEATEQQKREHERLRELGFRVDVIDNVEGAKKSLDEMGD
jgi:hypothetical protein